MIDLDRLKQEIKEHSAISEDDTLSVIQELRAARRVVEAAQVTRDELAGIRGFIPGPMFVDLTSSLANYREVVKP